MKISVKRKIFQELKNNEMFSESSVFDVRITAPATTAVFQSFNNQLIVPFVLPKEQFNINIPGQKVEVVCTPEVTLHVVTLHQ